MVLSFIYTIIMIYAFLARAQRVSHNLGIFLGKFLRRSSLFLEESAIFHSVSHPTLDTSLREMGGGVLVFVIICCVHDLFPMDATHKN